MNIIPIIINKITIIVAPIAMPVPKPDDSCASFAATGYKKKKKFQKLQSIIIKKKKLTFTSRLFSTPFSIFHTLS